MQHDYEHAQHNKSPEIITNVEYSLPRHPDIQSLESLYGAHRNKVYFSGKLTHRLEWHFQGERAQKDVGWTEVFVRLIGAELRIWDTNVYSEAEKAGTETLPNYYANANETIPTYVNVTDAVSIALLS
jgi:hypothetical protein